MSDEELDAAFPYPPPPSPVDKKKLPFIDTVHFIIPKQSDIKDKIDSKRCVKHHSVLCKICPIITKAKKILYKSKTQKRVVNHVTDLTNHGNDPINIHTDPTGHVGNPEQLKPQKCVTVCPPPSHMILQPPSPKGHTPPLLPD